MTHDEFRQLVAQMRAAQREYFKTRSKGVLIRARTLEAQVDKILEAPVDNLFNREES